jgi:hypothetical protein
LNQAFVATFFSFFKEISIHLTKIAWYVHGKKKLHGDDNESLLCIALDCVQYKIFLCRINAKFAFFLRTRLATFVYNSEFFFTCLRKSLIANLQEKNFQIIIYFSSYHIQDLKEVSSL